MDGFPRNPKKAFPATPDHTRSNSPGRSLLIIVAIIALGWLTVTLVVTVRAGRTGFASKTLWDWLELLIVPAILAIGVWWLNRNEQALERQRADRRQREEWTLEERRANVEREISVDRQNQILLNQFLDRMSSLLLDNGLQDSAEQETIRSVARARVLATLTSLDPDRRSQVMRFLVETKIAGAQGVIDISEADLSGADLKGIDLRGIDLEGANLSGANLTEAKLDGANLQGADLSKSLLIGAQLNNAQLRNASLRDSLLIGAVLDGANLSRVDLIGADLTGASLANADLRGSDLRNTRLNWTKFPNAHLGWTDMSESMLVGTDLDGANLQKAFLTNANMTHATISEQQLRQVKTFEHATMPDGTSYQSWIDTGRWVPIDMGPDVEVLSEGTQ